MAVTGGVDVADDLLQWHRKSCGGGLVVMGMCWVSFCFVYLFYLDN